MLNPFEDKNVSWLLESRAEKSKNHPFLIWEPFDGVCEKWTYSKFLDDVKKLSASLVELGIGKGDAVIIHMDNCPEFLISWFALARLGALTVTTNTRSKHEELCYFAENSNAKLAITQPKYLSLLKEISDNIPEIVSIKKDYYDPSEKAIPEDVILFDTLIENGIADKEIEYIVDSMLPCSVQYTSGTTSRPKGVVWTHANALWGAKVGASHMGLSSNDVALTFLPLFHTNALSYSMLTTLWSGGSLVLQPKFSASKFWDVSARHSCTWSSVIPFVLNALAKKPPVKEHHYRFWGFGISDVPQIRQYWGVDTIGWWGMTETVTQGIIGEKELPNQFPAIGAPALEYHLKIVDEEGNPVPTGVVGELLIKGVRGVSLFKEYLNDLGATEEAFDQEGYFHTGDLVAQLPGGQIAFSDRKKDMLKVGAENVSASEIEQVIRFVPGVVDAAVVGKADEMLDEVPVAFVVADKTVDKDLLKAEIFSACEEKLSDFKVPRDVIFMDEFPVVTLNKVDKRMLKEAVNA